MIKYTIDIVREMFLECGYELVSESYVNLTTPLKYICKKHRDKGIQEVTMQAFKAGKRCVYCSFESGKPCNFRLPEDIYKEETERRGYVYVGNHTENNFVMIDFECPKHHDYGLQTASWHDIRTTNNCCKVCNGSDRSTADFDKMVKEQFPHIDVIGEYLGARKKVKVRCNIDGNKWEPFAYNLLSGCGCSKCHHKKIGNLKRISKDDKLKKLESMHPDIQFLSVPNLARDNIRCKCKECGHEWYASYDNLTKSNNPTGCPRCTESKGEKAVQEILAKWGYSFTPQKKFEDLKDSSYLPFDVYMDDFNTIIEYDGQQHYTPIQFGGIPYDEAEMLYYITKKHDEMKNEYCKKNNINLIRIPYWELDDIEYYLFDKLAKLNIIVEK